LRIVSCLALCSLFALAARLVAADNTLTPAEKHAGWILLFDGKSMNGWRDVTKLHAPGDAWYIEEDALRTRLKPRIEEDLVSEQVFGDFELMFDWKLAPGGNTGLKYRIQDLLFVDSSRLQIGPHGFEGLLGREMANPISVRSQLGPAGKGFQYTIGYEFQLLDDERHRDAKNGPDRRTGALYAMLPPTANASKPAGEWNTSRLVVKGTHVEHWVNGVKVLDGRFDDPTVIAGVEKRWKPAPKILEMLSKPKLEGPISLQHHGDAAWFKNLKIRRL
jgi:hypothetical protein